MEANYFETSIVGYELKGKILLLSILFEKFIYVIEFPFNNNSTRSLSDLLKCYTDEHPVEETLPETLERILNKSVVIQYSRDHIIIRFFDALKGYGPNYYGICLVTKSSC